METHSKLIEHDPSVMNGKPVVAGTCVTVEVVLEKLARGETVDQILQGHPTLTSEGIQAALLFAAKKVGKKKRDSFVRWQKITIDQLGYAVNLILALSTASLGFAVSLIVKKDFALTCGGIIFFFLAILAFLISIALGIWCVINRLCDFRTTAETARRREEYASDQELYLLRAKYRKLGERTWTLFWLQIGLFLYGILTFIASVGVLYL